MLWIARTGCPWRDLPAQFPNWKSVYTRWRRWVQRRIWARVLAWLAEAHDREAYAVDATYVRVHAHGTRARGGYSTQAIGRSRGGLTSKVHLLTDALGYPVRFVVTGGDCNDVTQAPALLPPGKGAHVLCDRGYDADWSQIRPSHRHPLRSHRRFLLGLFRPRLRLPLADVILTTSPSFDAVHHDSKPPSMMG